MKNSCKECQGTGFVWYTDLQRAQKVRKKCAHCNGFGIEGGKYTGHKVSFPRVMMVQWYIEGLPVATIELWHNQIAGKQFSLDIRHMHTKKAYRKKGVMAALMAFVMTSKNLVSISTSNSESSQSGRGFLKKCGFRVENDSLIWERNDSTDREDTGTSIS